MESVGRQSGVISLSGYTDNVIVRQGILKAGVQFIQKPFTINGLLETIWSALHPIRNQTARV